MLTLADRWFRLLAWMCSRRAVGIGRFWVWLGFGISFRVWKW